MEEFVLVRVPAAMATEIRQRLEQKPLPQKPEEVKPELLTTEEFRRFVSDW